MDKGVEIISRKRKHDHFKYHLLRKWSKGAAKVILQITDFFCCCCCGLKPHCFVQSHNSHLLKTSFFKTALTKRSKQTNKQMVLCLQGHGERKQVSRWSLFSLLWSWRNQTCQSNYYPNPHFFLPNLLIDWKLVWLQCFIQPKSRMVYSPHFFLVKAENLLHKPDNGLSPKASLCPTGHQYTWLHFLIPSDLNNGGRSCFKSS